jgi:hypothetical protein
MDRYRFPAGIVALEVGDFMGDDRHDLAVLLETGRVHFLEQIEGEFREARIVDSGFHESFRSLQGGELTGTAMSPRLVRSRISAAPKEDVVIYAPASGQIQVIVPYLPETDASSGAAAPLVVTLDYLGELGAVLPMRLNDDALDDLIVVGRGRDLLSFTLSEPLRTYVVDSDRHDEDADLTDGECNIRHAEGKCTLWAAIQNANL